MNKPCPSQAPDTQAHHTAALTKARKHLQRPEITHISFDVFDTLLLRRCTDPSGVFEKAYSLLPLKAHSAAEASLFIQYRQLAERKAREEATTERNSPEVTISEIYTLFPNHVFGLDRNDIATLINAEHAAECALCYGNREILDLLLEAQKLGKKCGLISDTYWNAEQLQSLLLHCIPDLDTDFLYASCDHRSGKSEHLFHIYANEHRLCPTTGFHMGDNLESDVRTPSEMGFHTGLYLQADPDLSAIFQREDTIAKLIGGPSTGKLDHGLRTARRQITGKIPQHDLAFTYGSGVIGPVMTAFDSFIAEKITKLRTEGRTVAVAFLARDGLLPYQIWQTRHNDPAGYSEINRRTALLAAANSDALPHFFARISEIDLASASSFLKGTTPQLEKFFQNTPNGIVKGSTFAKALPNLLDQKKRHHIAEQQRSLLLQHIRATVPNFDSCTDLVLVDLGYSGTVQKGLRAIFDAEKLPQRIHGIYLLAVDEELSNIASQDTACGYLGGTALSPIPRRHVLKNISILEQVCSAATGSVLNYTEDGQVQREEDTRHLSDKNITHHIKEGVLAFAAQSDDDAFAQPTAIAPWVASILARALWQPTDPELSLLAPLRHDVNLGTRTMARMVAPAIARAHIEGRSYQAAMNLPCPPMWTAGSLSAASPVHSYLYSLYASGYACEDMWSESPLPETTVIAFDRQNVEHYTSISVNTCRTMHGDLRLRIPMIKERNIGTITIPATALPPRSQVVGFTIQTGPTLADAAVSDSVTCLDSATLQGMDLEITDTMIRTISQTGCLLMPLPELNDAYALITLTIRPLDGLRILAPSLAGEDGNA